MLRSPEFNNKQGHNNNITNNNNSSLKKWQLNFVAKTKPNTNSYKRKNHNNNITNINYYNKTTSV